MSILRGGVLYLDLSTVLAFRICERRAYLRYGADWSTEKDPDAPMFGRAAHAAVAHYRMGDSIPRCLEVFVTSALTKESNLKESISDDPRRSIERGIRVLEEYFKQYPRDTEPWEVLAVEQGFAEPLLYDPPVIFEGRIDAIVRFGDDLMVVDNKFTGAYGDYTGPRLRPNDRLTGYCWVATQSLKKPVIKALLDVTQIFKVKTEFSRGTTTRSSVDMDEWLDRFRKDALRIWDLFVEQQTLGRKDAGDACHLYGGCMFRPVCSMADKVLEANLDLPGGLGFVKRPWEPY